MKKRLRSIALSAVIAAGGVSVGVATTPVDTVSAATWTSSCSLSRSDIYWGTYRRFTSSFRVNWRATVTGGYARVTHLTYSFAPVELYLNGVHAGQVERGNRSNINVIAPSVRRSPDSMAPSGTYNFSDFVIFRNTNLKVQGVLDVKNVPDMSCTTSYTASW
jgi:hypothetical protein